MERWPGHHMESREKKFMGRCCALQSVGRSGGAGAEPAAGCWGGVEAQWLLLLSQQRRVFMVSNLLYHWVNLFSCGVCVWVWHTVSFLHLRGQEWEILLSENGHRCCLVSPWRWESLAKTELGWVECNTTALHYFLAQFSIHQACVSRQSGGCHAGTMLRIYKPM